MASITGILNESLNVGGSNNNMGDPLNGFFEDGGYQFQDDVNNNFGEDLFFGQLPPMPSARDDLLP